MQQEIQGLITVLGVIALYLVPSIVAWGQKHKNTVGIVILNVFLGWTFIGWVVALIWAVSNKN